MKRIHLFLTAAACLSATALAIGQQWPIGERQYAASQRFDDPPSWAVGNWVGRNDYRKSDVDLQIGDDGRAMITFRVGPVVQSQRGSYRVAGRLEFGGDRYLIRQRGNDLEITRENERRDTALLHRVGGGPLSRGTLFISEPREDARVRQGSVTFSGESNADMVEITLFRDGREYRKLTASVRNDRFETRTNLQEGRYEALFRARERNRTAFERRLRFTVTSGRTLIESPRAGENFRSGPIPISGVSEADAVEIEIYRGRDRVFVQRVPVRNGHFSARPTLGWGHYDLTVRGMFGDERTTTDKRGFEVDRGRPTVPDDDRFFDLRLTRPGDNARITDGSVEFEGTTEATEVRIQIFRGRDRVVDRTVRTRDRRFSLQIRLERGRYEAVVTAKERGREGSERRVRFEMTR